ncbi:MAG TPA: small ribosomal subunit Rsm22 family protein [Pseudolabrys sp.]
MTGLPNWLSVALNGRLEAVSRGVLRDRAQTISDTYRAGGTSQIIRSDHDALAYAVVRMPATYAAVRASLAQAMQIIPEFAPRSILDVGAGPGTASWAAANAWPSIERTTLIDSNAQLLALARQLGASRDAPGFKGSVIQGDAMEALSGAPMADAVMASYALTEIAPAALIGILAQLWKLTGRLLVLVEPGTVDGFKRILAYRDVLLVSGAQIIAPCSHEGLCPLAESTRWCHFSERLPRSRDHQITKSACVPFEDEKFAYLIAGKGFTSLSRGRRILATPKVSKGGISLTLCAPERAEERVIGRAEKVAYKEAKRYAWGDVIGL